jgi:3-oxoacyl-[acyl-carrier protein] reductase
VDVTKERDVKKFIDSVVKANGRIDVLVNNAGAAHPKKPVEAISVKDYEQCMHTNVDSVFYFLQAVVPLMKKQGSGIIINISSGAGRKGHPGMSVYSASKFAVQGFTEAVAKELENTGVKCIALCPGGVNTQMRAALFGKEDAAKQQSPHAVAKILRDILLGKINVPNGADVHVRDGSITAINDNLAH